MSSNNETLIKEHGGKFYVFENIQAESWVHYDEKTNTFDDTRMNELPLSAARKSFDTQEEALTFARAIDEFDDMGGTEYGVQFDKLCKDGANVKIV